MSIVPNKPTPTDPYQTLGLSHDATPSQIKSNYRKLALQYHPDRQSPSTDNQDEITSKFVEIAAAYAILSDPAKKREYDHLYKFGAFDTGESDSSPNQANNNYQYTENYSGGYYTTTTTPLHRSRSNVSTDSFFDDIMYSPESRKKKMCREGESRTKRGIGFAFAPLGKHLSVHVPSRNEIVMGMARGERMPNLGTRVTFHTQKVENTNLQRCSPFLCTESLSSQKFVSTTTRIARGRQRVVKRTAVLHPDGRKEVVIEEDGVVRRRYVEEIGRESCNDTEEGEGEKEQPRELGSGQERKENRCWFSDIIRGMQGVSRLCFAPCGPVLATVPDQDL